jgi:tRNA(Arg) A34 adenosine deaminase TadA
MRGQRGDGKRDTGAMMLYTQARLALPAWVPERIDASAVYADDEAKIALAIELARINVEMRSGGPFGAAVFDPQHRIVAVGVNRVVSQNTSLAHAENMACLLAQQRLQNFRINACFDGPVTLATSAQPCCQCYGATIWAGIDRLLIAACAEDVMALTEFDEGPLPQDWIGELEKRGIEVVRDVLREQACAVLKAYGEGGGEKY